MMALEDAKAENGGKVTPFVEKAAVMNSDVGIVEMVRQWTAKKFNEKFDAWMKRLTERSSESDEVFNSFFQNSNEKKK
jgi:hypothetical protein